MWTSTLSITAVVILLVFHLYLLARPQYVKRFSGLFIGIFGLALAIVGGFFQIWGETWARVLVILFSTIGALIALAGATLACCGSICMPSMRMGTPEQTTQTPPPPPGM